MMAKCGIVKRTPLSEFESPSKEWDHCAQAGWGDELLVTSQNGNVIRILIHTIRVQGRNTQGVRIRRLDKGAYAVAVARIGKLREGGIVVANGVDESSNADGGEE